MDIIKKKEKVFISPVQEIKGKKRHIWPRVVLVLTIILIGAAILTFAGYFIFDYFKAKNLDSLVKLAPNNAETYIYLNKEKITNDVLKTNDFLFSNPKTLAYLPEGVFDSLGNENALVFFDNYSLLISKNQNFELFNNQTLKNAKISYFDYRNRSIYNVKVDNKNFYYCQVGLTGEYLALSDNDDILRKVVDANFDQKKSLKYDKYYTQINKKNIADSFLYLFSKKPSNLLGSVAKVNLPENLLGNFLFLEAKEKDSDISFKIYTDLALEKQISFKEPFKFLPNKAILAYSGNNLQKIYLNLKDEINNDESLAFLKTFDESVENAYGLNLNKDLLLFFDNNFEILVLPGKKDKNTYAAILEIKDENILSTKMKILEDGLIKYFARQKPREKRVVLSDGSEGIELLPDISKFKFVNFDFEKYKLRKLVEKKDNKKSDFFAYCFFEDKLFLASSSDTLKDVLKSLENSNAKFGSDVKANNGLLYLDSLNFLDNFGIELKGDLTAGFEDGNVVNGVVRIY